MKLSKRAKKDEQKASKASKMQHDEEQLTLFTLPKSAPAKRALLTDFDRWKTLCDALAEDADHASFYEPVSCTRKVAQRIKKELVGLTKPQKDS